MALYDISRAISAGTANWPGDTRYTAAHTLRIEAGDSVNLTHISFSPHTGTHADAPYHFEADGPHPDVLPLEAYIGPAQVVSVTRRSGGITPADVGGERLKAPRLLIHTWCSSLPDKAWPEDFPYPSLSLIDWLAGQGGLLLGVDMPSVDDFHSKDLPGHHRLWKRGLLHLESLRLEGVPDGVYDLAALPLRLAGACGSPVRAVLRTLPLT